jgi:hypothetical protein
VYVAGWIWMVSPPAALAALTAAWMVVNTPVPPYAVNPFPEREKEVLMRQDVAATISVARQK